MTNARTIDRSTPEYWRDLREAHQLIARARKAYERMKKEPTYSGRGWQSKVEPITPDIGDNIDPCDEFKTICEEVIENAKAREILRDHKIGYWNGSILFQGHMERCTHQYWRSVHHAHKLVNQALQAHQRMMAEPVRYLGVNAHGEKITYQNRVPYEQFRNTYWDLRWNEKAVEIMRGQGVIFLNGEILDDEIFA